MSEFPTPIAPLAPQPAADTSGTAADSQQEAPEPAPITEQEVGEYREQDRYLPVCRPTGFSLIYTTNLVTLSRRVFVQQLCSPSRVWCV